MSCKKRKVEYNDFQTDYQTELRDKIKEILKSKRENKNIVIDDTEEKIKDNDADNDADNNSENYSETDEDILESVLEDKIEDEFYSLVTIFSDKLDIYLDYDKILESFIDSIIDNNNGMKNRCLDCGEDMGQCNPRQLCGKSYCMNM